MKLLSRKHLNKLFYLFLLCIFVISCSDNDNSEIQGSLEGTSSLEIQLQKKPIHFKDPGKSLHTIRADEKGTFNVRLSPDSQQTYFLLIDDKKYPLVISRDTELDLTIHRDFFPDSVSVKGYPDPWDDYFSSYRKEEVRIQKRIEEQLPDFIAGKSTDILELYKHRYKMAKRHLGDTPLDIYHYKNIGDYLVKRLEHIAYNSHTSDLDPQTERDKIMKKAAEKDFFSFKSLYAQGAGLSDFIHAYALTLEPGNRNSPHNRKQDINLEQLETACASLLNHINHERAKAFVKMHLITMQIDHGSVQKAEKSYEKFLDHYEKDYPSFTSFLKDFYNEKRSNHL